MKGFSWFPNLNCPNSVSIEHYGSEQKYQFPLKWDPNGITEMTWTIPKDAKLGFYEVRLLKKSETEQERTVLSKRTPRMDLRKIQGRRVSDSSPKRDHPATDRSVHQCQRRHA